MKYHRIVIASNHNTLVSICTVVGSHLIWWTEEEVQRGEVLAGALRVQVLLLHFHLEDERPASGGALCSRSPQEGEVPMPGDLPCGDTRAAPAGTHEWRIGLEQVQDSPRGPKRRRQQSSRRLWDFEWRPCPPYYIPFCLRILIQRERARFSCAHAALRESKRVLCMIIPSSPLHFGIREYDRKRRDQRDP